MTTHTPGPWKHVAVAGGWDGVANSTGAVICKLAENNPANARLIASAPDLLAAGEAVLARWGNGNLSAAIQQLAAAIAAARGESV